MARVAGAGILVQRPCQALKHLQDRALRVRAGAHAVSVFGPEFWREGRWVPYALVLGSVFLAVAVGLTVWDA